MESGWIKKECCTEEHGYRDREGEREGENAPKRSWFTKIGRFPINGFEHSERTGLGETKVMWCIGLNSKNNEKLK